MKKYVIPGTCPRCGMVPGCQNRDLKPAEREELLRRGCDLTKDVFKRDISTLPNVKGEYNQALAVYHHLVCKPLAYPTWHARVLED